jgi:hypothetical protein
MDPLWAPFGWHEDWRTPGPDELWMASVKSVDTFGAQAREPVAPLFLKLLKNQSIPPAGPA